MPEIFINKIERIIFSNIGNEKFGVSELASEMGLSRSQLLRKIKSVTGKSANHFIREIRLNEAAKLILESDSTASEIAYKVGFSSPSYFNKCFLDQYGVTPGEYKKSLEKGEVPEIIKSKNKVYTMKIKQIIFTVLFILVLIAGYFILYETNKNSDLSNASIAILPLLDLSENSDKEYLADGITEAITLELSRNESIRVISRGSAMKFKGENKLYSEVAKELGVDLLLEGSVLFNKDTLRVVVQLIEPYPKEKHIWANSYDQEHSNVLELVHNVSNEIANEISRVVKPDVGIETYVVTPEAYDLYLRGRHLWNTQNINRESLLKAVGYLNEAIIIDPKFAPSYVTLAETYLSINTLIGDNKEKLKYREYARTAINKALELDQSLAEAYVTKGNLIGKMDWNWEEMKRYAEKGIQLDPNNSDAHLTLSNYYVIKGDYKKAIDEVLKAEKLDPINPLVGCVVAERYYIAGDFDRSIEKYKEVIELNPNYGFAYNGIGFAYFKAGYPDEAINAWQKLQTIMGNEELFRCYDEHSYQDCFEFYITNAKNNEPRFCSNPVLISTIEMLLDDEKGALHFLDIGFQYKNEDLPVMMTYPDFYSLYDKPEFQEIIQKVGVLIPN